MPRHLYMGLDVGGTSSSLLAQTKPAGGAPSAHSAPGANPQRVGMAAAAATLARLIREAARRYPDAVLHAVVAGIAGVGGDDERRALRAALHEALGDYTPPHLLIKHDAALTLDAALGEQPGIVVIAGTGSVVLGQTADGDHTRAGGWGYLLGDEGSGYVLALEGLRAVARAFDGGPATLLQPLLAERHGLTTPRALIDAVYGDTWEVQDAVGFVLRAAEADDTIAREILTTQTRLLAEQVARVADRIDLALPRVMLWGGLMKEPTYRDALENAVRHLISGCRLGTPPKTPVEAALQQALSFAE